MVLMPAPMNPPQIPTTSRVGRSHLQQQAGSFSASSKSSTHSFHICNLK